VVGQAPEGGVGERSARSVGDKQTNLIPAATFGFGRLGGLELGREIELDKPVHGSEHGCGHLATTSMAPA
jgi:hypothetical protein